MSSHKPIDLKAGIFWDQFTDEQIYLYRNSLEDISFYLRDDVLSCHSVQFDSNFHNIQLENLYNALIDAMHISSTYFTRRKMCHKKRKVG